MPPSRLIVCLLVVGALALSGLCFVFYHVDPLYQPVIDRMEEDNTQTIVPTDPGPNPEERLVPPTPKITAGECPPPTLSIRVALVGNEYLQQLPLVGYGGIEAAVENLARGVANYIDTAGKREYGDWCAKGWVEIKELIVVVPKRSQTTDLNGNPYPFRVLDTRSGPRTPPTQWIGEVRKILEVERPDVIWSQSDWSANGLRDLGIPIICTIHDSGDKQFSFGGADKNLLHYRFVSASQRERWARSDQERAASSVLWQGLADSEYVLGNETERGHYLYVSGRWGRQKGIDDVLQLAELNPHDLFRAYGSSDLEDELREFSRTHANFQYAPDLKRGEDHLNAFRHAKGLLMFTRMPEAFGRVTIEAMSKGTPVFGTRHGANPELITPEVGFISDTVQEVNEHLHDKFNHTLIYELARQRHHVGVEVRGMLDISHKMLRKQF